MQTNFTPEQLRNPRVAEADAILRRCVHCGLCTATCPTYVLLGDERDSPRGRIYLIKDMLEDNAPAQLRGPDPRRPLPVVPVLHDDLPERRRLHAPGRYRAQLRRADRAARRFKERFVRRLLARVLPYPERFRLALKLAPLGRPWLKLLRRVPASNELAAMIELAPAVLPPSPEVRRPRHRRDRGGAARARHPAGRLRAAGAAPRHQRFHHPPAGAARRRRRRRGRRRLLRRAHLSPRRRGERHRLRQAQRRCLVEGAGQGPGRRHHRQRVGLRHDGQGLRPPVASASPSTPRAPPAFPTLAHDISEFVGKLRAGRAQALVVAARRLPPGLLAAARPGHQGGAARSARSRPASASSTSPRRTSAAARPAPTTSCSRSSPARCATARRRTSSA